MFRTRWFTALALCALLAACTGDDPDRLLASAKGHLAKGEFRSAVIELKSALQQQPGRAELRFYLGKALLEAEEPAVAAVDLRKALELGHSREEVLPLLAKALLQQGQHKQVIAEFGSETLDNKASQAALKTTLGWSYLAGHQLPNAEAAFLQAQEALPGYVPAAVAQARLKATRGGREAGLEAVEALIRGGASDEDLWVLKGDLLAQRKADWTEAIAAYKKAIEVSRRNLAAHGGIVTLHLAARDLKAATEQAAELRKVRPNHPVTSYYSALVAYENRDFKTAKELVSQVLKGSPDSPLGNQLAGAIEVSVGSPEVARAHLNKTLQAMPGSLVARRLHATASLRLGDTSRALSMIEPLLALSPPDVVALSIAGEAHMQNGDVEAANAAFAKAAQAEPSPANQTALARMKLLKNDVAGALVDLHQIATSDAGASADFVLIDALLRKRDFPAALAAVDALERKMPKSPLPWQLRGVAYLGSAQKAQARENFEKALSHNAAFFPAAAGLAALDVEEKNLSSAEQRFQSVLKAQPGQLRATMALAQVRMRNGATVQQVAELFAETIRLNPSQAGAHLALVSLYMESKQFDQAVFAAQRAEAALPTDAQIVDALGRAQIAAGQHKQAISTFNRLAALRPDQTLAHKRLADANLLDKDTEAAIKSLQRAVAIKPESTTVLRLFALQMRAGRTKEALALARDIQRRQPAQSIGFVLEGDALRASNNLEGARAAYEKGMTKNAQVSAATRLHGLLAASGKTAEASKLADTWMREHPKDAVFALYLADNAMIRNDFAGAEKEYLRVLTLQPENVIALNNTAFIRAKAKQPDALAYAQKAAALKPRDPALLDTLALALAAGNQVDKAIEVQKKALELAPGNYMLQLGLARLHAQAGQKKQARELLEPLDRLGEQFRDHAEVKSLLATL